MVNNLQLRSRAVNSSGRTSKTCVKSLQQSTVRDQPSNPGLLELTVDVGWKLTKAYAYLGAVQEHKQVIPFRRFNGGVGRASQAKVFKTTQGMIYLSFVTSASLT